MIKLTKRENKHYLVDEGTICLFYIVFGRNLCGEEMCYSCKSEMHQIVTRHVLRILGALVGSGHDCNWNHRYNDFSMYTSSKTYELLMNLFKFTYLLIPAALLEYKYW